MKAPGPRRASIPKGASCRKPIVYTRGDSDLDVLKRAHAAMDKALDAAWAQRAPTAVLKTPDEALILASHRREGNRHRAGPAADRRPCSSNRLRIGMPLQTDPTVIYGLGDAFDGNIRKARPADRHALEHLHARRPAADADRDAGRGCAAAVAHRRRRGTCTSSQWATAAAVTCSRARWPSTRPTCALPEAVSAGARGCAARSAGAPRRGRNDAAHVSALHHARRRRGRRQVDRAVRPARGAARDAAAKWSARANPAARRWPSSIRGLLLDTHHEPLDAEARSCC